MSVSSLSSKGPQIHVAQAIKTGDKTHEIYMIKQRNADTYISVAFGVITVTFWIWNPNSNGVDTLQKWTMKVLQTFKDKHDADRLTFDFKPDACLQWSSSWLVSICSIADSIDPLKIASPTLNLFG